MRMQAIPNTAISGMDYRNYGSNSVYNDIVYQIIINISLTKQITKGYYQLAALLLFALTLLMFAFKAVVSVTLTIRKW